jgi:hypothetical protein
LVVFLKGGESLHSVQEVFSAKKRRISIQGWFHTDEEIRNRELATISLLTKEVFFLFDYFFGFEFL